MRLKRKADSTILNVLDWILRITGFLGLVGLASDLVTWAELASNFLEFIANFSVSLPIFIAELVHSLLNIWSFILDIVLWFLPDQLRKSFAVAIILMVYFLKSLFTSTDTPIDNEINGYDKLQPLVMLLALLLVAIDGIYVKTVYPITILYVAISIANHAVANVRTRKGKSTSTLSKVLNLLQASLCIILVMFVYFAVYFKRFRLFHLVVEGVQAFYISFNLYALSFAVIFLSVKCISGLFRFIFKKLDCKNLEEAEEKYPNIGFKDILNILFIPSRFKMSLVNQNNAFKDSTSKPKVKTKEKG